MIQHLEIPSLVPRICYGLSAVLLWAGLFFPSEMVNASPPTEGLGVRPTPGWSVIPSSSTIGTDPLDAASRWLQEHASSLGALPTDFTPIRTQRLETRSLTVVSYTECQSAIPIEGAQLRIIVSSSTQQCGVTAVLSRTSERLPEVVPRISGNVARRQLREFPEYSNLVTFSEPTLTIVGTALTSSLAETKLAWKFHGYSSPHQGRHRIEFFTFFVDAESGALIWARDEVCRSEISGSVMGKATPGLLPDSPLSPPLIRPIPGTVVGVPTLVSTFTEADGEYSFPVDSSSSVAVETHLAGTWATVTAEQGTDLSEASIVPSPGVADFVLNSAPTEFRTSQTNAFVHSLESHDFYKSRAPLFTGLDLPLQCFVNLDDTCGAFFLPSPLLSLNFFASGDGCPNTAYSTVVSHEYAHFIVDRLGLTQLAFGEGFADAFSVLRLEDPVIAADLFGPGQPLRDIEAANQQFPCLDEIHVCGQVLAGIWWDLRAELIQRYGEAIGSSKAQQMFVDWSLVTVGGHGTHSAHLLTPWEVLLIDDDNGYLTDGTPNYAQIRAAFEDHGIDVPTAATVSIEFPDGIPPALYADVATPITVDLLPLVNEPADDSARLHLCVNGGASVVLPMTWLGGPHYRVLLPPLPCGARIDFYFSATDEIGIRTTQPHTAPLSTYTAFAATDVVEIFFDDFETDQGWSTSGDATEGHWIRGVPEPVFIESLLLAPGVDTSADGQLCFMTGTGESTGMPDSGDVDGGQVILTSPLLDLSEPGNYQLEYWQWVNAITEQYFYPPDDNFTVEVSNDAGVTWTLVDVVPAIEAARVDGWRPYRLLLNMIPLTDSVQFRFTATDQLFPTHVECAIDDFRVLRLNCSYDETFRRGDANLNSSIQLDDVVFLLETIFEGSQVLYCPDAGDANDDGAVDLTDAITVLSYIFAGEPLPLPSVCGVDPTPDSLSCIQPDGCR